MAQNNYIKLPNQGNIASNIRLLYEMAGATDYADSHGYYSKRNIAEIAANALLITTGSRLGSDVVSSLDNSAIAETDNSALQNTKMRMQILRILGLVSADYDSEQYAITDLGQQLISDTLSDEQKRNLVRELFINITSSSESYDFTCPEGFHCYLGLEICYAFSCLDYRIAVDEMPIITTYDYREINDFIDEALRNRAAGTSFLTNHPHFPKTNQGTPLANPSNITRTINQILRYCNIIKRRPERISGKNYYVCTDFGRGYVDTIKSRWDRGKIKITTPFDFRKMKIVDQKSACVDGLASIYCLAGIDTVRRDSYRCFSPYQVIPETTVSWLTERGVRPHPDSANSRIQAINSSLTERDLRLRANFIENGTSNIVDGYQQDPLVQRMKQCTTEETKAAFIAEELQNHQTDDKYIYYPYINDLLKIIGLDCHGEVGRYDVYTMFQQHVVPVEVKSPTEETSYNQKGVRQAIENKICSFNSSVENDIDYATLVVGHTHPENDSDIKQLIDLSHEQYGINIIALDLRNLLKICLRIICDNVQLDLSGLLHGYGLIIE